MVTSSPQAQPVRGRTLAQVPQSPCEWGLYVKWKTSELVMTTELLKSANFFFSFHFSFFLIISVFLHLMTSLLLLVFSEKNGHSRYPKSTFCFLLVRIWPTRTCLPCVFQSLIHLIDLQNVFVMYPSHRH